MAQKFVDRTHSYIERLTNVIHKTGKGGVKYITMLKMDSIFCSCECFPLGKRSGAYDLYASKISMQDIDPRHLNTWIRTLENSTITGITTGPYAGYLVKFAKGDKRGDRRMYAILEEQ